MSLIDSLANAIARFENVNPGYNNPGAIWDSSTNSIKKYGSYDEGWDALLRTVNSKIGKGYTLYQFMAEYAPSMPGDPIHGTNNPKHYAEVVAGWLGVDPSIPLNVVESGGIVPPPVVIPTGPSLIETLFPPIDISTDVIDGPNYKVTIWDTPSGVDVKWWLVGMGVAAGLWVAFKD